jgi:RING-like zinc finger
MGDHVVEDEIDLEQGASREHLPWFETQLRCAICLEDFAKGDNVRVLPCEHIFHVEEIDDWLINRKKLVNHLTITPYDAHSAPQCPVCKADVTQEHPSYRPRQPLPMDSPSSPAAFSNSDTPSERTPLLQHGSMILHE